MSVPLDPVVLVVVLLVAAAALLLAAARTQHRLHADTLRRLQRATGYRNDAEHWLTQLIAALEARLTPRGRNAPTRRLLRQAGWLHRGDSLAGIPVGSIAGAVGAVTGALLALSAGHDQLQVVAATALGAVAGVLVLRMLLRVQARARQRRIASQVGMVLELMITVLEAGTTIEQAIDVVRREARALAPDLVVELDLAAARMRHGDAPEQALQVIADEIEVMAFRDVASVLAQAMRQGGSIVESLSGLVRVLADRRRTEVQEQVSRLSGKMSLVMMLLLFPALLIIVAGPGVLAMVRGLASAAGS